MRKINRLFTIAAMLLTLGGTAMADDNRKSINWSEHSLSVSDAVTTSEENESDIKYVYLYNSDNNLFLASGGYWGTEGIFANAGMRFHLISASSTSSTSSTYYICSRLNNNEAGTGDAVGHCEEYPGATTYGLFLDRGRGNSGTAWSFKEVANVSNQYVIYNEDNKKYIGMVGKTIDLVSEESNALKWYIITEAKLKNVIDGVVSTVDYIGVSEFLRDPRFERNNADKSFWSFSSDDTNSYISNFSNRDKGAFQTARIQGANTLKQSVSGLPIGYYRISCQGFYKGSKNTDTYLYYKKTKTTTDNTETTTQTGDGKVLLQCAIEEDRNKLDAIGYGVGETYTKGSTGTRSIKAGEIIAGDDMFATGEEENPYFNSIFFHLDEGETLEIGVTKENNDTCQAYVDNFRLFYMKADPSIYINANAKPEKEYTIDNTAYSTETIAYLRRQFALNEWNAICLPFNVPASSLKQAFGDGVKLSKLNGINPDRTSQIVFKTVDFDSKTTNEGIVANECYVIKPTKDPDVASTSTVSFYTTVKKNSTDTERSRQQVTKKGPIYILYGVTQAAYDLVDESGNAKPFTKTYTTNGGTLNYKGYYVRTTAPASSYIVVSGTMYHLTSGYDIYGTMWTLEDETTSGAKEHVMTLSIDDEDYDTSEISGLVVSTKRDTNTRVYNLSGMVVGTAAQIDSLPKGIYIMNGKKFVVR